MSSNLTILDAVNIILGTATRTELGTSAAQKLGFWRATPIPQPAHTDQNAVTLANTDDAIGALTYSDPPTQAECQALRDKCEELADDVRNLLALIHALRTALMSMGAIKGSS